jgi:hypothetical protein
LLRVAHQVKGNAFVQAIITATATLHKTPATDTVDASHVPAPVASPATKPAPTDPETAKILEHRKNAN